AELPSQRARHSASGGQSLTNVVEALAGRGHAVAVPGQGRARRQGVVQVRPLGPDRETIDVDGAHVVLGPEHLSLFSLDVDTKVSHRRVPCQVLAPAYSRRVVFVTSRPSKGRNQPL